MRQFYFIILFIPVFSSCRKSSDSTFKNVKGILEGAPGCSEWIIRQDNGTFRQPLNLNAFKVTLKGGQPVIFSFTIMNSTAICMTGETIELTAIQDQ